MRKTIYSFTNKASLGINLIPKNSIIEIENIDGNNKSLLLTIKDTQGLDETTTIKTFLETTQYQIFGADTQAVTEPEYSFVNISGREIIDVVCDGRDYRINFSEDILVLAEPQGIVPGASGYIEITNPDSKEFDIDEAWQLSQYFKNTFRYTVLPSGVVALTGI